MKENKFAKGYCFYKYFWVFMIGSIFGVYWEQIYTLVLHLLKEGVWVWRLKRGVIYGPFNPLYGMGAVFLTMAFAKRKNCKWYHYLLYGALLGGFIEYLTSYLQELVVGSVSWDYHDKFLNINGRTTIPYAFFWGFLALIWNMWVYPKLSDLIEKIDYNVGEILTRVMIVFMIFDCFISWSSIIRQNYRRQNIPPFTIYGEFLDKYYPDEFLAKYYTNMTFIE